MNDSPRRDGSPPTEPLGNPYPAYTDPAYAGQSPYGPTYSAPAVPSPTQPLSPYTQYNYGQYQPPGGPPEQPPPPEPPRSPRWLWLAAGLAGLLVVGLVVALVVVNSSTQETVVAPLPSMPEPSFTSPTPTPTTTSRIPVPIIPLPPLAPPGEPTTPGLTESVVYEVTGDGRAINITYVDTGSMMQTEFNVVLPWRREVELPKPAQDAASVTIINVGREVTCTVSVNGIQVRERTGAGLTICTASG